MDLEAFKAELQESFEKSPPQPGFDWSMVLAVAILRALDRRDPGFAEAAKAEVERMVSFIHDGDDAHAKAGVSDLQDLVDSWVFTDMPSKKAGSGSQ